MHGTTVKIMNNHIMYFVGIVLYNYQPIHKHE